jgi:hypothetical protein
MKNTIVYYSTPYIAAVGALVAAFSGAVMNEPLSGIVACLGAGLSGVAGVYGGKVVGEGLRTPGVNPPPP